MKRSYDSIVFFYDQLAGLVYGRSLVNAQLYLINAIPAESRVLIIGGGTGWVLEEIAKLHSSGLIIDYIDASPKMIARAERRAAGDNKVTFITAQIQDMKFGSEKYDVVLTPFLFDNFTNSTVEKIFSIIDKQISGNGIWLHCDFRDTNILWQRAVLKIMYAFFRYSCGIEATWLPDIGSYFSKHHYKVIAEKTYLNDFVVAAIYKRG